MDPREHLQSRLRADREDIIDLVRSMVRIPSENPPGDTTEIFAFVMDYLEKRGLPCATVAPQPTMPNVYGTFDGGEPGKHLVLNGHLDVFPAGNPADWSDDPCSGAIRDGKLFGRGVIDMKVGTAASILTFAYLSELRSHLKGRLSLTAVSDEETAGRWGTRYLLENYPELLGDCVLNGEPSTPSVVRFGEKGMLWIELNVHTMGGHGGHTQMSANAIKETAQIIGEIERLTAYDFEMPAFVSEKIETAREAYDARVGDRATDNIRSVTVNVGMISGGYKVNLIAAECRTEVDIRGPVGVSTDEILREFEAILRNHVGASYAVINRNETNWCDPNHEMVGIIQRNAEAARGIRPLPNVSLAGTDCRFWRMRGVPAYVYGPTPHNMGAPDEYAALDDLLGTVEVHVLSAYDYLMI